MKRERMANLCILVTDGTHDSPKLQNEGVPFIKGRHISSGIVDFEHCDFIKQEDHQEACRRVKPQSGDILFSNIGSVGDTAVIKSEREFSIKNVALFRADPNKIEPSYLYYLVMSPVFKANVMNVRSGSAQPFISLMSLRSFDVDYHEDLAVQRRIADILSAYDDLIENNMRRIQILEQMAQALYQEWFVHFRFPGHAQAKLVASPMGKIPQGWEVATLTDVCKSVNDGDWIETKDQGGDEYRLLQISNVGVNELIETGNFRYITQDTFARLRCQEVLPDDILISRMPTPIGRAWLVTQMPWRMITAVDVAIVKVAPDRVDPYFLTYQLNSPNQLAACEKNATGTTRPRISKNALCSLPLVIPPMSVQKRYGEFVSVGYAMVTTLRHRSDNLRHTRDLLLPKLISGELDVLKNNFEKGEINYA